MATSVGCTSTASTSSSATVGASSGTIGTGFGSGRRIFILRWLRSNSMSCDLMKVLPRMKSSSWRSCTIMKLVSKSIPATLNSTELAIPYVVIGFPFTATNEQCFECSSCWSPRLFQAVIPMIEGPAPVSINPFNMAQPLELAKGISTVESSSNPIVPSTSIRDFIPLLLTSARPMRRGSGKVLSAITMIFVRISAPSMLSVVSTGPSKG